MALKARERFTTLRPNLITLMKIKTPPKQLLVGTVVAGFVALNGIGYIGAYVATHYQKSNFLGLGIPRPQNETSPADFNLPYTTHKIWLNDREWLDSWSIESSTKKGIVILFHGKDSNKSSLLDAAKILNRLGYDVLLVDFRGVGNSSGDRTTIGVTEAEDVVSAVAYTKQLNLQKPIILYGISMGSAAILRAIAKDEIQPEAIILELPFTSLLDTIKIRIENAHLPPSPLAQLVVFWTGVQHGFNGFAHNPIEYAKAVDCPTLILVGERDRTMEIAEVEKLYQNLDVPKNMVIFPEAGHEVLARADSELWTKAVRDFLEIQ